MSILVMPGSASTFCSAGFAISFSSLSISDFVPALIMDNTTAPIIKTAPSEEVNLVIKSALEEPSRVSLEPPSMPSPVPLFDCNKTAIIRSSALKMYKTVKNVSMAVTF